MRIAVTTDLSEESRRPFEAAAELARAFEAELLVVHQAEYLPVLPVEVPEETYDLDPTRINDELRRQLESLAATDPALARAKARPVFLPPGDIQQFARLLEDEGVDLAVVATHGTTGWKRLLLGSFTEQLLRVLPCATLVHRVQQETGASGQDQRGELLPRRLLVAWDLSSERSHLDLAREWAKRLGAHVRLLYVIEHDPGIIGCAADALGGWREYHALIEEKATAVLREEVQERWEGIDVETDIRVGSPPQRILEEEKAYQPDLTIVGSRGSEHEHLFVRPVAETVARRSTAPVLVVPLTR